MIKPVLPSGVSKVRALRCRLDIPTPTPYPLIIPIGDVVASTLFREARETGVFVSAFVVARSAQIANRAMFSEGSVAIPKVGAAEKGEKGRWRIDA